MKPYQKGGWSGEAHGAINVLVDGRRLRFFEQRPEMKENEVYVPLRALVEALGGKLKWNWLTQTAELVWNNEKIEIKTRTKEVLLNGRKAYEGMPIYLRNKRIMVPSQFLKDVLKLKGVEWMEVARTLVISHAKEPAPTFTYRGYTLPKSSVIYSMAFPVDDEGGVEFEVFLDTMENLKEQRQELEEILASKFGREKAKEVMEWVGRKTEPAHHLETKRFETLTGHRIFAGSLGGENLIWVAVMR